MNSTAQPASPPRAKDRVGTQGLTRTLFFEYPLHFLARCRESLDSLCTAYVKITEKAGCIVCVCIWYTVGRVINDTLHCSQGGVRVKDIRCTGKFSNKRWARFAGSIAVSAQTLLTFGFGFGRKWNFRFRPTSAGK